MAGAAHSIPDQLDPRTIGRHDLDRARRDPSATRRLADLGVTIRASGSGGRHRTVEAVARITSLDGLRGIAALVVLVHHVLLTQPALAAPYRDPASSGGGLDWWLTYTPLHLVWAGTEAVFVFFVLSGLVLALPAANGGRLDLRGYYPRRLLRLYLPVAAAVVLAVVWATAVPRRWGGGDSWWLVERGGDPGLTGALADMALLVAPGSTNHVLWSLQWEVIYCLALPAVLVAARAFPRFWLALVVLAALVTGAATDSVGLHSLSFFALGTLMAIEHRRLHELAVAIQGRRYAAAWWWTALTGSVAMLLSYWFVHGWFGYSGGHGSAALGEAELVARGLQAVGAGLLVFVVWHWPGARRAMTSRLAQWLGSRSFSLYLVHLPVVVSVALLLGGRPPLGVALVVSVAFSLALAEVFFRLVERPSHRLARTVGYRLVTPPRIPLPRGGADQAPVAMNSSRRAAPTAWSA